jgi:uncharacterized delta-60 repeat protein
MPAPLAASTFPPRRSSARLAGRLAGPALTVLLAPAFAQSPAPLPRPNLDLVTNGNVMALLRLADGSRIVGGQFTSINGTPRLNLAKLRPDGTLDPDWHPAPDREVYALADDGAGHLYVGGWFYSIGGQDRDNLARIDASGNGTADPTWNPAPSSFVYALSVDAAGRVYAGGQFDTIGGQTRQHLARLSASGSGAADPAWNPAPDGNVLALVRDASGALYAAGAFWEVAGQPRRALARFAADGTFDAGWDAAITGGSVTALAIGSSLLYAGGEFTGIGGQGIRYIARLATTGALDAGWNPAPDRAITAVAVDASGAVYAAGPFTTIGGRPRNLIAKLTANASADPDWHPAPNGSVAVLSPSGGSIDAGGRFFALGGSYRLGLATLDSATAAVFPGPDVETPVSGASMLLRRPYGLLVGGQFLKADGLLTPYALRLGSSGSIDTAPHPDDAILALIAASIGEPGPLTVSGLLRAVVALPDGSFVFGGSFTSVGGTPRNYLAKLRPDGTLDPQFDPSASAAVYALAIDAAGQVYAGGRFTSVGGQPRERLVKLDGSSGAIDPTWNPGANDEVGAIAVDASGEIYAGGAFTAAGGQARNRLVKLVGASGSIDTQWNPGADRVVRALAVDDAGRVYAGGDFATIGGVARERIAKLDGSSGAVDPVWSPGADDDVRALAAAPGGLVYAGGDFDVIGGLPRRGLAALAGSDALFADGFEP